MSFLKYTVIDMRFTPNSMLGDRANFDCVDFFLCVLSMNHIKVLNPEKELALLFSSYPINT